MRPARVDRYRGPVTLGFDVSKWNGNVDWKQAAASEFGAFAGVRLADGKTVDPLFGFNYAEAGEYGVRRLPYVYFRADRGGLFQADLVLHTLDVVGCGAPEMGVCLDWEGGTDKDLRGGLFDLDGADIGIEDVCAQLLICADRLEAAGHRVVIYTLHEAHWTLAQVPKRRELARKFGRYPLWVPGYGSRDPRLPLDRGGHGFPWPEWTIHQYSSKGSVPGVRGRCDVNRFRGDMAALDAFCQR